MSAITRDSQKELKQKWIALKEQSPKSRIKDCAEILKVSELELLATDLLPNRIPVGALSQSSSGEQEEKVNPRVTVLAGTPWDILARAKDLGYVMALTRNDSCVHERKGIYGEISVTGKMGLFTGEDIDLRIFFHSWKYSLAVEEEDESGNSKRSLQFFDRYGRAVHKIHLNEKSNHAEFQKLVRDFQSDEQSLESVESLPDSKNGKTAEGSVAVGSEFLEEWANLKDTHDFFGLLNKHKISRLDAMKVAEGKFTKKLDPKSVSRMLYLASERNVPIMVFVGNPGMIQIHTGEVKNIQPLGPWINVMDPEFNLHLREDKIASAWYVKKPTEDGDVNAIEVYDENAEIIVQFFGKRKPGLPERQDWRDILSLISE
jgi:putative hemin transport protein